jgi:hypothetical protein
MSFLHTPSALSLAIGSWLTLLDLAVRQHFESRRLLAEFDTVHRPTGESVLHALERAGLVEVQRTADGRIDRVIQRANSSTIFAALSRFAHEDFPSLFGGAAR